MHLSDEELLELRHIQNSDSNMNHLSKCDECHQRLDNLDNFRHELALSNVPTMQTGQWFSIRQRFIEQKNTKQNSALKRKFKRLQIGFATLAASLLIVLLIPTMTSQKQENKLDLKLNTIINENNQLQQLLNLSKNTHQLQAVANKSLEFKLKKIDGEIQLSYLENLTTKEKIKLWEVRRDLLINSMKQTQNDKTSTI